MIGIYIGIALLGLAIIVLFLDQLPTDSADPKLTRRQLFNTIIATFKLLVNPSQLFAFTIPFYIGIQQGYRQAEFNKAGHIIVNP